jgi:hypothetical protein
MLNESERGYYISGPNNLQKKLQKKNIHRIAQAEEYSCDGVEQAIIGTLKSAYHLSISHPSPVAGPYYALPLAFEPGQLVSFPRL